MAPFSRSDVSKIMAGLDAPYCVDGVTTTISVSKSKSSISNEGYLEVKILIEAVSLPENKDFSTCLFFFSRLLTLSIYFGD